MAEKRRIITGFILLALLLAGLLVLNLVTGSASVGGMKALSLLFAGRDSGEMAYQIVWNIRLPRLLSAACLGGALAVSGFLLQTFFSNPIAGPFVLGISSGAKLCVAAALILAMRRGMQLNSFTLIAAAFAGAMASTLFILLAAGRVRRTSTLIICGVMIGYICSAVTEILVTFAQDENIVNLHNWSMGSFSGISTDNLRVIVPVTLAGLVLAMLLSKPMDACRLGETYARSLGVNMRLLRVELIALSSLLSACVTAYAGPISFVGIAVPHLVRRLMRTTKPIIILPASFLGGAVFCLLCDLIARMIFAPTELSISTVTAVLGAPVVIWILVRRRER